MTTDCLSGPRERERAEGVSVVGDGRGSRAAQDRPATTVPVIPLWERLRTEVRG
ncbi:hypothetical protein AB0H86_33250 [Streptomyces sp. NPDC050997]|uniref:hypothetical protein n=1 Tax=Streptomyces sp. NPDC050997 TaxID=3155519 RepID=UPI00343849D4